MGDQRERAWIDRPVIEPLVEFGLRLGLGGELNEFPGEPSVRRSLDHAPGARTAYGAVPDQLDRHARLLQLGRAPVPDRHHVDFAVADELLRLIALPPPHFDMRLDLLELLESAIEVE